MMILNTVRPHDDSVLKRWCSYSVENSIDDLEILLKKLGVRRFHLYGHSYGGMLAYEYIKRIAERKGKGEISDDQEEGCLSVVLSSSGTSIPLVEAEWDRLEGELTGGASFRKTHQCRTLQLPEPLERAFQKMGKTWAGFDAIPDYELSPPSEGAARMPSALILRGEYDFSTELCNKDWNTLFNHKFLRKKVLEGCSHFALLENGSMYGEMLESFFSEYD